MDKVIDALLKVFEVLIGTNPLAAILFLSLSLCLIGLRKIYNDGKDASSKYEALLKAAPLEKEAALKELTAKHDLEMCAKDKEIAVLHDQYADLSRDTTQVLRGMEQALVSGNPKKLLTSIHNGIISIGHKGHNLSPIEMGMNSISD